MAEEENKLSPEQIKEIQDYIEEKKQIHTAVNIEPEGYLKIAKMRFWTTIEFITLLFQNYWPSTLSGITEKSKKITTNGKRGIYFIGENNEHLSAKISRELLEQIEQEIKEADELKELISSNENIKRPVLNHLAFPMIGESFGKGHTPASLLNAVDRIIDIPHGLVNALEKKNWDKAAKLLPKLNDEVIKKITGRDLLEEKALQEEKKEVGRPGFPSSFEFKKEAARLHIIKGIEPPELPYQPTLINTFHVGTVHPNASPDSLKRLGIKYKESFGYSDKTVYNRALEAIQPYKDTDSEDNDPYGIFENE